eukprot:scaffold13128_cov76-Phaeocystis_antarctica.AAC.3
MNLPAPHLSHVGCLVSGCTVPALHGVGSVLPVGAEWPLSVGVHRSALRRAGACWAVRSLLARLALRLLLPVLKSALGARRAETHPRVSCDRAGAAGPWHGAARGRVEARLGRVALRGAAEVGTIRVRALLAWQRCACAKRAEVPRLAGDARLLALVGLVPACRAPDARGHARVWRDRARTAPGLPCAARWRVVALGSRRALRISCEVSGVGVRAFLARQRRAGALRAVRPGLAGDARLLALTGLVLAGGAPVAEGSARGGRNETGRAVSAVGWVRAPRNRIGLPRSARLARHAAILAAVWVERAGGARRKRLPQARRSLCRTRAPAWTVAALGRADVLAQLARRAGHAACASFVRVEGTGCARNAACLYQPGDADGEVCPSRTQEWLCGRSRAVLAATVALATASVLRLLALVAEVASRALVRAASEVHWGQGQRRWRDPQAERAVDDGIFP